jgi:hypothetical protein
MERPSTPTNQSSSVNSEVGKGGLPPLLNYAVIERPLDTTTTTTAEVTCIKAIFTILIMLSPIITLERLSNWKSYHLSNINSQVGKGKA